MPVYKGLAQIGGQPEYQVLGLVVFQNNFYFHNLRQSDDMFLILICYVNISIFG